MGRWSRRRRAVAVLAGVALVLFGGAAVVVGSAEPAPIVDHGPVAPGVVRGAPGADLPPTGLAAPADATGGVAQEAAPPDSAAPAPPVPGVPVGSVDRTLVRTAQLAVEVDDADAAGRRVRTAAAAAGGYVTEEQAGTHGGLLVLRVPAAALDRLLDDVAAIGTVVERSAQVVDATEQVVDLDARVASQRAGVDRVRALLAQARSIGDIVAIESELSRREADLDSLVGRLKALRDQAAMSTLTIDLRLHGTVAPADRALGFADGLGAGWAGLRSFALAMAVVAGFVLPFLPVLALLAAVVWLARRTLRARRAA